MVQTDINKIHPLVRMFRAAARPFTYVLPIVTLITLVMSLLSFRIFDPYFEVGYAAGLYILAVFYLGGMFSREITLFGFVTLFAVPLMLFFISIKTYWPIIIAVMPAISKAFSERERDHIGKIISYALAAVLIVGFIPASIISCDAYKYGNTTVKQAFSPDDKHMVEISVVVESPFGGKGKAELYEVYPLSLQRSERTLVRWDYAPLQTIQRKGYPDKAEVAVPADWKDNGTIVLGDYTIDIHNTPEVFDR
jgi:hypothetical protein